MMFGQPAQDSPGLQHSPRHRVPAPPTPAVSRLPSGGWGRRGKRVVAAGKSPPPSLDKRLGGAWRPSAVLPQPRETSAGGRRPVPAVTGRWRGQQVPPESPRRGRDARDTETRATLPLAPTAVNDRPVPAPPRSSPGEGGAWDATLDPARWARASTPAGSGRGRRGEAEGRGLRSRSCPAASRLRRARRRKSGAGGQRLSLTGRRRVRIRYLAQLRSQQRLRVRQAQAPPAAARENRWSAERSRGKGKATPPHGHRPLTGTAPSRAPPPHGHRPLTGTAPSRAPPPHGHRPLTGTAPSRAPPPHGHRPAGPSIPPLKGR
ncbi:serine/arginine repetitive matrix protein 3-like [Caloenas nicobarica]|uniref:serine/arginine repetitive matrix protein 3-like n=1 Tax=Caloenas nicobarica TaxID=187106 RepID=UPI0032B80CA7